MFPDEPGPEENPEKEPQDPPQAQPDRAAEPVTTDDAGDEDAQDSDYAAPFVSKTFGGSFVWARGEQFVATVLRVKENENVVVSTQNRRDMYVMLTGGRAVLEVGTGDELDRVELIPVSPVLVDPNQSYRLIALTEVELFTVYSPQT